MSTQIRGLTWHEDIEPFLLTILQPMGVIVGTKVFPCVRPIDIGQRQYAGEVAIRGLSQFLRELLGHHPFPHHRSWTRASQNEGAGDIEDNLWL